MSRSKSEILVTLLCASQVLHETLDELEDTPFYQKSFKQAARKFKKELTKVCDPVINQAFPEDPEVFNAVMEGITDVSKILAKMDPDKIAFLTQLINKQTWKR